jgi:hypothetical protein
MAVEVEKPEVKPLATNVHCIYQCFEKSLLLVRFIKEAERERWPRRKALTKRTSD